MSRYILDCDPGHDDAVALLVAARHLDLVGVTTVFGNSTVENTTRNALAILAAAGLGEIPVAMGAAAPLAGSRYSGESVHGKSGLDGADFPPADISPVSMSASRFIAEAARRYDDLAIIAIAPETNVAMALQESPEIAERIAHISMMGGSTTFGNATAAAEFNIFADPEAAAVVFDSGIPITMVGLNVTTTFGVTPGDIAILRNNGTQVARELAGALQYYLDRQSSLYARDYAPIHDICAVLPFSHPGLVHHEPMHVAVELDGALTRGMTVCDQRGIVAGNGIADPRPANADVATGADGETIVKLLLDTLCEFP